MRRREATRQNDAPSRMRRFRAEDWPLGCHPECSYWAAVHQWLEEHPDDDFEAIDGPDAPFHRETI